MEENKLFKLSNIAPEKLEGVHGMAVCDGCKKRFFPKKTLLEKTDAGQFHGLRHHVTLKKDNVTYYMVSPCCKKRHPYGFEMQLHKIRDGKRK